jgi:predicted AlkP superfamily phosphohydrolase/phosphomutase
VVLSDHGFSSFRRAVHVNRWLVEQGYLALLQGAHESAPLLADIDWSRSRAYALGLNGLFLNQAGREGQGIVDPTERAALLQELSGALAKWQDEDGSKVIRRSFLGTDLYPGPLSADAPDLVLGYAPGFRASWQTSLGAAPPPLIEDNRQFWSGDHCIDPEAVPGILLASFQPDEAPQDIAGMAHFLLKHTPAGPTAP